MFKKFSITVLFLFLLINSSYAEVISKFKVIGNERVSTQTILNFSNLNIGDDPSKKDLNDSLKQIYETNFFEDVSINIDNSILSIYVKEYPIIQDIKFNGIKAKKYIEILKENTLLKPKSPFNKFRCTQTHTWTWIWAWKN